MSLTRAWRRVVDWFVRDEAGDWRLAVASSLVMLLAVALATVLAYGASRDAILRSAFASGLEVARAFREDVEATGATGASSTDLVRVLEPRWRRALGDGGASFACVVGPDGRLLSHSADPSLVGRDVGDTLLGGPTADMGHLQDLITRRADWSGFHVSLRGEPQLVAFAYAPSIDGIVAVHRPRRLLTAELRRATLPWFVGVGLVGLALVPLTFFATLRVAARAHRAESVAQQEKAAATRRLSEIIADHRDVLFEVDESGTVLSLTGATRALLGIEAADVIGRSFVDYLAPEQVQAMVAVHESIASGARDMAENETVILRPDGERRRVHFTSRAVVSPETGQRTLRGTVHDITSEHAAREGHLLLGAALEESADAVVVADPDGRIEHANAAAHALAGRPAGELRGQGLAVLDPVLHSAAAWAVDWERLARGEHWSHRTEARRPDGTTFEEETRWAPVRDADGMASRALIFKRDVTRQARIETRLAQLQKMEAVGTLAGGIAHDFNNLLTGMLFALDRTRTALPGDSPALEPLSDVLAAAERAAELTRQLLTVAARRKAQLGAVDVAAAVQRVVRLLQGSLPASVSIATDIEQQLPRILADEGQLEQALLNLGLNAGDALPNGGHLRLGASLELRARGRPGQPAGATESAPHGRFILLSVSDDGVGIPQEEQARVFEPFFTTKQPGKGTGLGLAMVAACAKAHGGYVTLQSTVGEGSRFEVYLPLVTLPASPQAAPEETPRARASERVLFVDDMPGIVTAARHALADHGFEVLVASDGREALEVIDRESGRIGVVVTDLAMPRLDGRGLLAALRARGLSVPVVLCTGHAHDRGLAEVLAEGFAGLLHKPFRGVQLARAAVAALGASAAPPAGSAGQPVAEGPDPRGPLD